jgi:hypothetical protein
MHADEINRRYQAPVVDFRHDVVVITLTWAIAEWPLYEAVRHAWKLNPARASKAKYVLAARRGMIIGVFEAECWLPAKDENFPGREAHPDRWGFVGREAPKETWDLYVGKRLPDTMTKKEASNPVRYAFGDRSASPGDDAPSGSSTGPKSSRSSGGVSPQSAMKSAGRSRA